LRRRRLSAERLIVNAPETSVTALIFTSFIDDGRRKREYVSLSDLPTVLLACKVHRDLQAQLWQGRAAYQRALAQARALLRMLSL